MRVTILKRLFLLILCLSLLCIPVVAEENEKLQKYGAEPVKALDRIKHSYEKAMADTDNRLLTQSNAKTSTRNKKAMTPEEAKKLLEAEAAKSAETK